MGMPCQVNSILKIHRSDVPDLVASDEYKVQKSGYRIIPIDVPIPLVDQDWMAYADVVINQLVWEQGNTMLRFVVKRLYPVAFSVKIED
jgi:hypothetical protein